MDFPSVVWDDFLGGSPEMVATRRTLELVSSRKRGFEDADIFDVEGFLRTDLCLDAVELLALGILFLLTSEAAGVFDSFESLGTGGFTLGFARTLSLFIVIGLIRDSLATRL
jgi:hypothetical protein